MQNLKQELDQALDFQTVLEQIAQYATFTGGQDAVLAALPKSNILDARNDLILAAEALEYTRQGKSVSMAGVTDVTHLVQLAEKRHTLLPKELLDIYYFLLGCRQVKAALKDELYPGLSDLASVLADEPKLLTALERALDRSGSLKPDASPELKRLSAALVQAKNDLSALGRNFVKSHSSSLMEQMTTTIAGRLCVLVKTPEKNAFGGLIHGTSQSGQATYVEPASFVVANNRIQELQQEIEEEKTRICQQLTREVANRALAILSSLETLTVIDLAMAKGKWASAKDGSIPILQNADHTIRLEHALHPLLDRETGVPNDYALNRNEKILLMSGPNMGGKTVTMKTIGLLVVLALSGFPVPAHHALVPWYESFYFDIGDTQSIAENLSTFSSHMTRISRLARHADGSTFALLDEIGNGTDPQEGASLAIAILEHLADTGATLLASTHYSDVKSWAKSREDVLVSSMEFNPDTLSPTYKYLPGQSGASYALDIARTCGLPEDILESAKKIKSETASRTQKELERLEILQEKTRKKQERFDALIADAHKIQKDAETEKTKWQKKKESLDTEYTESLEAMLAEKEQEAQEILDAMKTGGKVHELLEIKRGLHDLEPVQEEKEATHTFAVGDYVKLTGLNTHGEIVEIKKKEATVLANGIKTRVKLSALEPMARPVIKQTVKRAKVDTVSTRFSLELNIIGMHVEEGLRELDQYLDQAIVHNATQVRIIHGMGTGKLRTAVWNDLKKRKTVKNYQAGGPSDGGLGATIVTLK